MAVSIYLFITSQPPPSCTDNNARSTVTLSYQFYYRERDDEAPQPPSITRMAEDGPIIQLHLWSDDGQLINNTAPLCLALDGRSIVTFPVTEAGECVATLALHAGGQLLTGKDKIFIPPMVSIVPQVIMVDTNLSALV